MSERATLLASMVTLMVVGLLITSITQFSCQERFKEFEDASTALPYIDIPVIGTIISVAFGIGSYLAVFLNPLETCGNGIQWISLLLVFPMSIIVIISLVSVVKGLIPFTSGGS